MSKKSKFSGKTKINLIDWDKPAVNFKEQILREQIEWDEPSANFKEQVLREQVEYNNYKKSEIMESKIVSLIAIGIPALALYFLITDNPLFTPFGLLFFGLQALLAQKTT